MREVCLKGMVKTIFMFSLAKASPVDGTVVTFGEIVRDKVEQVKGMTYTASGFLGTNYLEVKHNTNSKLYHCVIYLAPGDYHR